jgi:hypothetical protein
LKKIAEKEIEKPAGTKDQIELGDYWWNKAENEKNLTKYQLQMRSIFWYKKCENSASGLTQARIKDRIKQITGPAD